VGGGGGVPILIKYKQDGVRIQVKLLHKMVPKSEVKVGLPPNPPFICGLGGFFAHPDQTLEDPSIVRVKSNEMVG
jgi:hypothetical protein